MQESSSDPSLLQSTHSKAPLDIDLTRGHAYENEDESLEGTARRSKRTLAKLSPRTKTEHFRRICHDSLNNEDYDTLLEHCVYNTALIKMLHCDDTGHPEVAESFWHLACAYLYKEMPLQAELHAHNALNMLETLSIENDDTQRAVNELHTKILDTFNSALIMQQKFKQALKSLKMQLEMNRSVFDVYHEDNLIILDRIATCYLVQRKFNEASRHLEDLLELTEAKFGADNHKSWNVLFELSKAYYGARKYDKAVDFLRRCNGMTALLEMDKAVQGELLFLLAKSMRLVLYPRDDSKSTIQGRGRAAFKQEIAIHLTNAQSVFDTLAGSSDPRSIACLLEMGRFFLSNNDLDRADEHIQHALIIQTENGKVKKNMTLAETYNLHGDVLTLNRSIPDALPAYESCLAVLDHVGGRPTFYAKVVEKLKGIREQQQLSDQQRMENLIPLLRRTSLCAETELTVSFETSKLMARKWRKAKRLDTPSDGGHARPTVIIGDAVGTPTKKAVGGVEDPSTSKSQTTGAGESGNENYSGDD
eukprot:461837_1